MNIGLANIRDNRNDAQLTPAGFEYRPEIDGLRAIAVIPVILFHAGFGFARGGFVGVDIFFVISGYLITSIVVRDLERGEFTFRKFYERRARRILPALFAVMAVSMALGWMWLLPSEMSEFGRSLVATALFGSNILFWRQSGYFETATELNPAIHTWSLAVEEQFYITFPLLFLAVWRWGGKVAVVAVSLAALLSLAVSEWAVHEAHVAAFFLLPSRAWEILLGSIIALRFDQIRGLVRSQPVRQWLSGAGILLIAYACLTYDSHTPFPGLFALVPTLGALAVILFATPETYVGRMLGWKALTAVGLISYSAYLWHQPLFAFARLRTFHDLSAQTVSLLIITTFGLAYLTWRAVETPFRRKGTVSKRRLWEFAAIGSVFLIASGAVAQAAEDIRNEELAARVTRKLDNLKYEQAVAVNVDVCFYYNRPGFGLARFLEKWNCPGIDEPDGPRGIPVAVFGDSHAADITVALRENGLNPLRMSGGGCSLVPSFMTPDCRAIVARFEREVMDDPNYQYIALVNRFEVEELTTEATREMLAFWNRFDRHLIYFADMPSFPFLHQHLVRGLQPQFEHDRGMLSLRPEIRSLLSASNVHVINRVEYYCMISNCNLRDENGELLMWEDNHLTVNGARRFGALLVSRDSIFAKWTESVASLPVGGRR